MSDGQESRCRVATVFGTDGLELLQTSLETLFKEVMTLRIEVDALKSERDGESEMFAKSANISLVVATGRNGAADVCQP